MNLYVIRRPYGWASAEELGIAAQRSRRVGDDEMSDDIRWIRSYVVREDDGSLGTFCIYEALTPEAIRKAATQNKLPVDLVDAWLFYTDKCYPIDLAVDTSAGVAWITNGDSTVSVVGGMTNQAVGAVTLGSIGFGMGIAHGYATLGRIGFEGRYDYSAIGTVVRFW